MELSVPQAELQTFWANWRTDHGGDLPARRDMDTRENRRLFSYVIVFDVLENPLDFQYRLVGTNVRKNTFADYTGKRLTEMEGKGPDSKIWSCLNATRQSREFIFEEVPYVGPNQGFVRTTLLFLPLASDHKNPDKVFLVSNFIFRSAKNNQSMPD